MSDTLVGVMVPARGVWFLAIATAATVLPPACGGSGADEQAAGGAAAGGADGAAGAANDPCGCVDSELCAPGRDIDEVAALECDKGRSLVTRQTLDCGMTRLGVIDFDLGWTITFDESGRIVATSFRDGLSGAACDAASELARNCRVTEECYVCGTIERWRDPAMPDCT